MDTEYIAGLLSTPITRSSVTQLLKAEGILQQQMFRAARESRNAHQGDRVMLRGVIEMSNYCQRSCDYCAMRPNNKELSRYRLSADTILEITAKIKKADIDTVFFQSGQDRHSDPVLRIVIPEVKRQTGQNVLLNIGEKPKELYAELAELGADSAILKFETSDAALYENIAHSPLEKRLECIRSIKDLGYRIGTGNIVGLPGQTMDTLVDDIFLAREIGPDFVSTAPFIPNQNTPLEDIAYGDLNLTLNTMAILRILFPNALIPAVSALEKIHEGGQVMGLNAGANVVTINFTPEESRKKYAIYSEQRFVVSLEHAMRTVEQAGLQV